MIIITQNGRCKIKSCFNSIYFCEMKVLKNLVTIKRARQLYLLIILISIFSISLGSCKSSGKAGKAKRRTEKLMEEKRRNEIADYNKSKEQHLKVVDPVSRERIKKANKKQKKWARGGRSKIFFIRWFQKKPKGCKPY